jgi:hypothetical protein
MKRPAFSSYLAKNGARASTVTCLGDRSRGWRPPHMALCAT